LESQQQQQEHQQQQVHGRREGKHVVPLDAGGSAPGAICVAGPGIADDREQYQQHQEGEEHDENLPLQQQQEEEEVLVVAELAPRESELFRERDLENLALRTELTRIASTAVEADQVSVVSIAAKENVEEARKASEKRCWGIIFLLILLAVAIIVSIVVVVMENEESTASVSTSSPTASPVQLNPVLDIVRRNDVLRCRAELGEARENTGLTVDLVSAYYQFLSFLLVILSPFPLF